MLKMKACTSVHVGLLRNSWWSSGLSIRREGCVNVCEERSGGGASAGVGGGGADGGSRAIELRLRGISFGSLALRPGGGDGSGGDVAGIVCVVLVVEVGKLKMVGARDVADSETVPIVPSTNVTGTDTNLIGNILTHESVWHQMELAKISYMD
jgi:hypothetical protein